MTPVQADDRLLDSLGSALPPSNPNDWPLVSALLEWVRSIESVAMPAWVVR